jgi:hypothetical protein
MWVRRLAFALAVLFSLPAGAQEVAELSLARPAPPAPWSPRLYLMDGGGHALAHQVLLRERWPSIPAKIDSRWVNQPYPGVDYWGLDLAKIKSALTAFTNEAEKEQRVPAGNPRPLRILWLGCVDIGAPYAWVKQFDRLAKTALIIVPGGNDPGSDSSEYWTPPGLKVGYATEGRGEGATDRKKEVVLYVDLGPIEVYVPGRGLMPLGATSTASALFAGHLASVLGRGIGAALTPTQIAAKLRAGFRGSDGHAAIVPEDELEARITQVLSH